MNILIVDDTEYHQEAISKDLAGIGHTCEAYGSPMDSFKHCPIDWAEVLVIDISCCSSIMQPEHTYSAILSIMARQHNVKRIIINSAVGSSTSEWVAEDLRERLPDIKIEVVSWLNGNPFAELKDMLS